MALSEYNTFNSSNSWFGFWSGGFTKSLQSNLRAFVFLGLRQQGIKLKSCGAENKQNILSSHPKT